MRPLQNLSIYKFLSFILFLTSFSVTILPGQNRSDNFQPIGNNQVIANGDTVYKIAEKMPGFPNGQAGLMKFLSENIKYPAAARAHGAEGIVVIRLIIDPNGQVTEPIVAKSSSSTKDDAAQGFVIDSRKPYYDQLDNEALRVIKMMPNWSPGMIDGRAVSISFNLPIAFRLEGKRKKNRG